MRKQYKHNNELEDEVKRLKLTISERDSEINNLKREIHKLKVSRDKLFVSIW